MNNLITWRYSDIHRIRHKGRRAVLLPNGVILAKMINWKEGRVFWTIFDRRFIA